MMLLSRHWNIFKWKGWNYKQMPAVNSPHQFSNMSTRSQRRSKIKLGGSLTHLSSIREWLCLKTSPQDTRHQHSQNAFQLCVVTTAILGPIFRAEHYIYCFQAWGNSALACIFKNNSYWVCYSDFVNSLGFQTLLIWTHPAFKSSWLTSFLYFR